MWCPFFEKMLKRKGKEMSEQKKATLQLAFAMFIFGTIGIFRKYIPLESGVLAMVRGFVGMLFLMLLLLVQNKSFSWQAVRKNLLLLVISGALIGFNWILLFESYRYTSVSTATLCYYMAPVVVMLVSPLILREKLTGKKVICIMIALVGMVLVSGVMKTGIAGFSEMKGILMGLSAALLYASVILANKKIKDISASDKTMVQLGVAAAALVPYCAWKGELTTEGLTPFVIFMLLVVGIVHTGFAYKMYFGSMKDLKAQTIAIFSYIDPIVAIILSALLLGEAMGVAEIIGAVCILGATLASEMDLTKKE